MVGFCERLRIPPNYAQLLADSAACWSVDKVALSLWLRHCFVYIISKSPNQVSKSIQVVGHQDMKQGVHWPADFISHASISAR